MKIKLNKLKEAIKAVVNEQDLKKGDRISFKSDPKTIWTILGIQGDTYRINQQGERSISYQPKSFLHNMIATGKASINQNESINLKEEEDSNNKGYIVARDLIAKLRATTFRKFNDDELKEFRKTIANAFDMSLKEGLNEDKGTLNKIADMLDRKFDDLNFDVNEPADRIDVRGSQQDLANFGSKLSGEKIYGYEVFATDDDDRGEIVRIVKSDSISRGSVNEEMDPKEMKTGTYAGKKVVIHMHGPETEWKVEFINTGKIVDYIDLMANLKFDDGTDYTDYLKEGDGLWANIRAKKARGEKPARKGSKAYKIAKKAGDKINKEK